MENKNNYKTVVFLLYNQLQYDIIQNKLFKLGYQWYDGKILKKVFPTHFPVCVFIDINRDNLTHSTNNVLNNYVSENDKTGINNYIKYINTDIDENICPVIFYFDDVDDLEFIIKNQYRKPKYNPKNKIKRLLENKLNEDYIDIKTNNDLINFINNNININAPLFKFGDTVKMKSNIIELYDKQNTDTNGNDLYRRFLINNIYNRFKILELSYGEYNKKWFYRINNNFWVDENYIILLTPNYDSKYKINRLNEEYVLPGEADFRVWCDTVEKAKEFEKYLYFDLGWRWDLEDGDRISIISPKTFIFYPDRKIFDTYSIFLNEKDEMYEYPKDINIIKVKLNVSPNYNSKNKIKRTFETTNNFKYRFKTKQDDYYMYYPKNNVNKILESIQNEENSLYIFDLDDTLVYSDRFEDKVKHIISENIKPEDILKSEVNKLGINLNDLRYENGRIYLQDDNNDINIPDSSSWVRKKNRIYLIQPDSYYMTDESIPVGIYDKIVNLYNSVHNKMILTARKEKLRDKVISILNKFNIDIPNNGLYMYPNKTNIFASKWKAEKILEMSKDDKFDKIYYFDDNIKQIKKIKKILTKYNINIYFYRVNKNTYKIYEE